MKYAIIENGVISNIVVATPEYAAEQGWIECQIGKIGDPYTGQSLLSSTPLPEPEPAVSPPPLTKEELLAQLQALQAQINALE